MNKSPEVRRPRLLDVRLRQGCDVTFQLKGSRFSTSPPSSCSSTGPLPASALVRESNTTSRATFYGACPPSHMSVMRLTPLWLDSQTIGIISLVGANRPHRAQPHPPVRCSDPVDFQDLVGRPEVALQTQLSSISFTLFPSSAARAATHLRRAAAALPIFIAVSVMSQLRGYDMHSSLAYVSSRVLSRACKFQTDIEV